MQLIHPKYVGMLCVAILCLCLARPVQAESVVLIVDPGDTPLRITGILDGQTTSFGGNVRLTVTGGDAAGDAAQVNFLSSDLHHTTAPETLIDRSNVSVSSSFSLKNGQPSDIKVTVSNVKQAGVYSGTLQFLLPGLPLTQALSIPLELQIGVTPNISPVLSEQSFQVVRCSWLDCFLAQLLLNGNATRDVWQVQLDNLTVQPSTVKHAEIIMRGTRTAAAVTNNQIMIGPLNLLPADQVSTIPVTITRNNLLPDTYQGQIRFVIEGLDEPVTIKATLDVRNGPWWALVAILLGVVVGWMARDLETPVAKKQVKLLPYWYDVQTKIEQIKDHSTNMQLEDELQEAKEKIASEKETEEATTQFLDALNARVRLLLKLQRIEADMAAYDATIQPQIITLVKESRSLVLTGKNQEAETKHREIFALIHPGLHMPAASAVATPQAAASAAVALSTTPSQGKWVSTDPLQTNLGRLWQRFIVVPWRYFVDFLRRIQIKTPENRFWFHRLLSVLLLVLLVLLGLQTLYVTSAASFGVGGLYDYLGLFLWGITADVAQRTLFNLSGAKP